MIYNSYKSKEKIILSEVTFLAIMGIVINYNLKNDYKYEKRKMKNKRETRKKKGKIKKTMLENI